jgi:hypothetical protein
MKNQKQLAAVVASIVALVALAGCVERRSPVNARVGGGPVTTTEGEQPGVGGAADVGAVAAGDYVDDLRIGHEVDAAGAVIPSRQSDDFTAGDRIYVSMAVDDAPAGTAVRVSAFDEKTKGRVWAEEKHVAAGTTHLYFVIDSTGFRVGDYRLEVAVGDETVKDDDFNIVG